MGSTDRVRGDDMSRMGNRGVEPMKLEVGKYYRMFGGAKIGPMKSFMTGFTDDALGYIWREDGTLFGFESPQLLDLVAEWTDEPAQDEAWEKLHAHAKGYDADAFSGEVEEHRLQEALDAAKPVKRERKVVQIATSSHGDEFFEQSLFGLCDDSTVWEYRDRGERLWIQLPPIPQPE